MLRFRLPFGFLSLSLLILQATTLTFSTINASHAREALVNTEVLWTGLNHERSLLCKTEDAEPVQTCFWVRSSIESPDDPSLNITVPNSEGEDNAKYAPYGKGLMRGECGVTIKSVGKADFGFWNCTLITEKFGVFVGTTKVLQWEKPHTGPEIKEKPSFSDLQLVGHVPLQLNVTCCGHTGKPKPEFILEIGSSVLNGSITLSDPSSDETCATLVNASFTYVLNGLDLRCRMNHISFSDEDRQSYMDSVMLNILFAPVPQNIPTNSTVEVFLPFDTKEWNISTVFHGNPLPQLHWSFMSSRNLSMQNFVIHERNISNDTIGSTVQILDAQQLVPTGAVELFASNYLGVAHIRFEINFQNQDHNGVKEVLVVVLVIAVAFLTIAFVIGLSIWRVRRHRMHRKFPIPRLPVLSPSSVQNRATGEVSDDPDEVQPVSFTDVKDAQTGHL